MTEISELPCCVNVTQNEACWGSPSSLGRTVERSGSHIPMPTYSTVSATSDTALPQPEPPLQSYLPHLQDMTMSNL